MERRFYLKKFFLVFSTFKESLDILKNDRWVRYLSLIPFILSFFLYILLGKLLFVDFKNYGVLSIENHFTTLSGMGAILSSAIVLIMTFVLFLIINWTFVLIVAFFSSPFNSLISERCEKWSTGLRGEETKFEFKEFASGFFKILLVEVKKMSFILCLMVLSFVFSFIPLLMPFCLLFSSLLVAIQFLDYNWSRHNYLFSHCLADLKKNFVSYFISGAIFMLLFSLPYVNILFLPLGVVYYSLLWSRFKHI